MSKNSLVLTLGHNSSAIAIRNGEIVAGFEEERFSLIKSDSNFPVNAIREAVKHLDNSPVNVYVGHWFLDGKLPLESNKYWKPEVLAELITIGSITSLNDLNISHHDSHDLSAKLFVDSRDGFPSDYTSLVIDGFGTHGECISIYRVYGEARKLVARFYGFEKSLGMFYQYATSYMGMQMHNHEYKILAYETKIYPEFASYDGMIEKLALEAADAWFKSLDSLNAQYDPLISLTALPAVKDYVGKVLDDVLLKLGIVDADTRTVRIICSRFTQLYTEFCVMNLVNWQQPTNLVVSGGLFYNVKVNNMLLKHIPGKFCAMPLAGDQGAGLGVYLAAGNPLRWPNHLYWGHRDLSSVDPVDGIYHTSSDDETLQIAIELIGKHGFVNIVRGSMEFGPRALCNTSTIAIPNPAIVQHINYINDRTNEMPMAPVMTEAQVNQLFDHADKVHCSLEYMITALDYKHGQADQVLGAAHYYEDFDRYTGRPQIASKDDVVMQQLLATFGPLINTSFNYHGVPIVNTVADAISTHSKQRSHASNVYTIIQGDSL